MDQNCIEKNKILITKLQAGSEKAWREVVTNKLGVMDLTAITLCEENGMPIRVFDGTKKDNIYKVLTGDKMGTVIK